jgi:nitroimidazol reductase NimA-like FMN-containing flavoprotein (pyridoxamine 5'-phosphate oxidase superfamily)
MHAQNGSDNRTALGRHPERGHYDFETIAGILDDGLVCHVGVAAGDWPVVLPTIYGRIGKNLYVHGSPVARWLKNAASGTRICITVSILDALVLARSAYQHSLNYRSVVILDEPITVEDETEKRDALRAVVEHVCPGRWNDVRLPTSGELKSTLVLRVPIVEASAKIRTGPPLDFDFDMQHSAWAGLIPLRTVRGEPIADPLLHGGVPIPEYCLEERKLK